MTKTLTEQYEKGYSPSSLQRKYSLSYEQGCELAQDFKRLQEQLNEANEVIKFFANSQIGKKNKDGTCGFWLCSGDVAFDNPLERINNKMKYTCYDPRPAKKWLKKWGVK